MTVEIPSLITIHTKYHLIFPEELRSSGLVCSKLVVQNYQYLMHNKSRSAQFSATSWWKPVITYIQFVHFNSLAWQFYKLSYIFMQRYVISAVLPVHSVTIQDLEHTDGYYRKVETRYQSLYVWYSTVIVVELV
jgi:hypothetical protein